MIALSVFVALLWAIGGIFQKQALSVISPTTLLVLGCIIYTPLVFLYGLYYRKHVIYEVKQLTPYLIGVITMFVALSMFYSIVLYYKLLQKHDVHKVTAVTFISPIFTLLLASLVLGERITLKSVVGVLLIVGGVVCIS